MSQGSKTAFLVEDETLLLLMLEQTMHNLGYEVAATASSVASGLDAINGAGPFDVAVLDVNLSGDRSFPIARRLREHGVTVLFVTGYGSQGIPEEFSDCPVLQKPYTDATLARALEAIGCE